MLTRRWLGSSYLTLASFSQVSKCVEKPNAGDVTGMKQGAQTLEPHLSGGVTSGRKPLQLPRFSHLQGWIAVKAYQSTFAPQFGSCPQRSQREILATKVAQTF